MCGAENKGSGNPRVEQGTQRVTRRTSRVKFFFWVLDTHVCALCEDLCIWSAKICALICLYILHLDESLHKIIQEGRGDVGPSRKQGCRENTAHPVKFEFQLNKESLFFLAQVCPEYRWTCLACYWEPQSQDLASTTSHGLQVVSMVSSLSAPQMGCFGVLPDHEPKALGTPQGSSTLHQVLESGS